MLNKTTLDSGLEKINDAALSQSIFGRMFGFGDLEILTASDSAISKFHMIIDPIGFKKAILNAKHEYDTDMAGGFRPAPPIRDEAASTGGDSTADATVAMAAPAAAPATAAPGAGPADPDDVARTLASLANLRDRGAISAEEYEAKKADLLGRL